MCKIKNKITFSSYILSVGRNTSQRQRVTGLSDTASGNLSSTRGTTYAHQHEQIKDHGFVRKLFSDLNVYNA